VELVMAHVGEAQLAAAVRHVCLSLAPSAAGDVLLGSGADRRDAAALAARLQHALAELTAEGARSAVAEMVQSLPRDTVAVLVAAVDPHPHPRADAGLWRDVHAALEEAKSATASEWATWQQELSGDLAAAMQREDTSVASLKAAVVAVGDADAEEGGSGGSGVPWERLLRLTLARLSPAQLQVGYSDAKVANRDVRVWHGATEHGP
jgi:hypothetical protein